MLAQMKKIIAGHSERVSCTARDEHVNLRSCLAIEIASAGFNICHLIPSWRFGHFDGYI